MSTKELGTSTGKAGVAHIDAAAVKRAEPGSQRFILWDDRVKGFGLRVEPSGFKSFVVRYRAGAGGRTGQQRTLTLGAVTKPKLTAEAARKEAKDILARVRLGEDPQGERHRKRAEMTVADLCAAYLEADPDRKRESTKAGDRIRFSAYILPALGGVRLSELTRAHVETLLRKIEAGSFRGAASVRARGGPYAAARTLGLLQGVLGWAVDRKYVSQNPAAGVSRAKDRSRERFLSREEVDRLTATLDAMAAAERCGRAVGNLVTAQHGNIVRLLLLTGCRKNEVVRLRWSGVDLERGRISLQEEEGKTGARVVYLNAPALTILKEIKRSDSPFVFPDPADPSRHLSNIDYAWTIVRERAELPGVRLHDLRHSFASFALAGGLPIAFVGKLLGHSSVQTTSRYAHLAQDALAEAAELVGQAVAGGEQPTGPQGRPPLSIVR